jgi:uncharacterized protein
MGFPNTSSQIEIQSYKHNGHIHRVWEETIVLKGTRNVVIGGNDRTVVTESDGRIWITREPAICFFYAKHWFNIIAMIRDEGIFYYCNISSPFTWDHEALKYIDYDLDIKVFPDMTYVLLDEDEYEVHSKQMNYPTEIDKILRHNVSVLIEWIQQRKGPFDPAYIDHWYDRFLTY